MGLRKEGLTFVHAFTREDQSFAVHKSASQWVILRLNNNGARLITSVPPASTKSCLPIAISFAALSSACMPDAQLRCTVHAGTAFPQPKRKAITRPILVSSGLGITQPITTSSSSSAEKGCRSNNSFPEYTARSEAEKSPNLLFAFKKGVRAPSTI